MMYAPSDDGAIEAMARNVSKTSFSSAL